jgi:hypothetical protein
LLLAVTAQVPQRHAASLSGLDFAVALSRFCGPGCQMVVYQSRHQTCFYGGVWLSKHQDRNDDSERFGPFSQMAAHHQTLDVC